MEIISKTKNGAKSRGTFSLTKRQKTESFFIFYISPFPEATFLNNGIFGPFISILVSSLPDNNASFSIVEPDHAHHKVFPPTRPLKNSVGHPWTDVTHIIPHWMSHALCRPWLGSWKRGLRVWVALAVRTPGLQTGLRLSGGWMGEAGENLSLSLSLSAVDPVVVGGCPSMGEALG